MDYLLILGGVAAAVSVVFWFFNGRDKKLKPMVVNVAGTVRDDKDVIVRNQPVVVNIVWETNAGLDQGLLADVVVNYKDLLNGKYKATVVRSTLLAQEPLEKDPDSISKEALEFNDDIEEVDHSTDPGPVISEEEPKEEGEPENFKPADVSNVNFNF